MTNSRAKGKVGEREWVNVMKELGHPTAERTQQHKGRKDSFDVEAKGCPIELWEVKRRQHFNLHDAADKARKEAAGEPFAIAHRKNARGWLVTMTAGEFFRLLERLPPVEPAADPNGERAE